MSFKPPKKRNRQVLSCSNCRKKKRKCNRESPCGSCIKYGMVDTCTYSYTSFRNRQINNIPGSTSKIPTFLPSVNQELVKLKDKIKEIEASITVATLHRTSNARYNPPVVASDLNLPTSLSNSSSGFIESDCYESLIGMNPVESSEDAINFHSDFGSDSKLNVQLQRPLPLLSLLRRDPGAILILNYKTSIGASNLFHKSLNLETNDERRTLLNKRAQELFGAGYIPRVEQCSDHKQIKNAISVYGLQAGISYKNIDSDLRLLDKVRLILPENNVIWKLIQTFFDNLYPFFPIIDELEFRADVSRILIFSNNIVESIKIERRQDLATLAVLLIILRLSYLSFFKNSASEKSSENIKNVISLDNITMAELCLKEFDLTRQQSLIVLQALILLRIYRSYAPEEGNGSSGSESQSFNGLLINIAISLGLNRDPDYFVNPHLDERIKNLRRKIWYFLVSMDVMNSTAFATAMATNYLNNDIKLPMHKEGNSNIYNTDLEKQIIESICLFGSIFKPINKLLESLLNFKTDTKLSDLTNYLTELEIVLSKQLGKFSDHLHSTIENPKFLNISGLKIYIYSKLFLSYIYYCFYLYYEKKGNHQLKYFYFRKSIIIVHYELKGLLYGLLDSDNFGEVFALIIMPALEMYCYITGVVSLVVGIRLNSTIRLLKERTTFNEKLNKDDLFNEYVNCLQELSKLLENRLSESNNVMDRTSHRYYYAWRIKKAYRYVSSIMKENFLYTNNEKYTEEAITNFSTGELKECISLLKRHSTASNSIFTEKITDEELVTSIQLDNMWFQVSSMKQDQESVPLSCKEPTSSTIETNDLLNHGIGLFQNDFDLLNGMSFSEFFSS